MKVLSMKGRPLWPATEGGEYPLPISRADRYFLFISWCYARKPLFFQFRFYGKTNFL